MWLRPKEFSSIITREALMRGLHIAATPDRESCVIQQTSDGVHCKGIIMVSVDRVGCVVALSRGALKHQLMKPKI